MSHLIHIPQRLGRSNFKQKWLGAIGRSRHPYLIVTALLLVFLLSSCAGSAEQLPVESNAILTEVDSSVAATLSSLATASAQNTPTSTPTLMPTATFLSSDTPTLMASATPTTAYYYYTYSNYTNYGCEDASYIKDVTIPDGTVLTPGESFTKTWKFRNTGSCNWTSDFSIVFVSGNEMDGASTGIAKTVKPNKIAEISVELTAPDDEGTYYGYWQLEDEYGNTFGDKVYVEIEVEEATATYTSTPTATYTATAIPTLTSVPTSTPTVIASTATYTSVATSTPTAVPTAPTATSTVFPSNPTATPTSVPVETMTPTPASVPTSTPTATSVPTSIPTSIPTATLAGTED
jgi:hypothetical protein